MAEVQEMTVDKSYAHENEYFFKETLSATGAGKNVRVPGGDISAVSYQLTGDGTVEVTNFPQEDIENDDPGVVWITVPVGADISPAVTFIRHINVSGTTIFNVRAQ